MSYVCIFSIIFIKAYLNSKRNCIMSSSSVATTTQPNRWLIALAAFLLDYVGRLWQAAEKAAWLSPFRYYNPLDLVMGKSLPEKNLAILGAIAAVGFAMAYVLFARRDVSR